MQYREFGRTGWKVSEIGFGAWQIGGTWGPVNDKDSIETLLYAFEKGINFVDTAIAYGNGHSELVIGKALQKWKGNKIYITTKVHPQGEDFRTNHSIKDRYTIKYLKKEVEGSLKRLNVDTIDLLQLHLWFEDGLNDFVWLEGLSQLIKEGKIRSFGVSLPDINPASGIELAKTGIVTSQQVMYNIFEQEPNKELFRVGEASKTAFIARVPFDSGALTGSWNDKTYESWDTKDKRHAMYRDGRFKETLQRIDKLKSISANHYASLAEMAMRFSLSDKAVSTVICGMTNKKQIDMNIQYSDGKQMNHELLEELKQHEWKHQFYV